MREREIIRNKGIGGECRKKKTNEMRETKAEGRAEGGGTTTRGEREREMYPRVERGGGGKKKERDGEARDTERGREDGPV